MLQPHLLPTAADLARLACTAVVAVLTVGMGLATGARRLDTAFFSGWGLACLLFVGVGTWSPVDLACVTWVAGGIGLAGLLHQLWRRGIQDCIGPRVLLIGAPLIVLVAGMADIAWDDFAFWVPNLLHLCATGHFPTRAHPVLASVNAAYPYGLALPGFGVHLMGGTQVDTIALVWNVLALLAVCAASANLLSERMRLAGQPPRSVEVWGIAGLGVVLAGMANPAFVPKILLSNMGDSATGAGLAMLCALLFKFLTEPAQSVEEWRQLIQIALVSCLVMFLRQANPALLGLLYLSAGLGLIMFHGRRRAVSAGKMTAALVPACFIGYSWTRYANLQIPGGQHYLLPWAEWHWQYFGDTLVAASRVLLNKPGYTVMVITLAGIVAWHARQRIRGNPGRWWEQPAATVVATAAVGLAFGNILFLLFCYLATSFVPDEARSAIAFWRFVSQTGLALTVGLACVLPMSWLAVLLRPTWMPGALAAFAMLLPVAAVGSYRDDLTSPAPRLRMIAEDLRHLVPSGEALTLVDFSGNGYAALVVKYQMAVVAGDTRPLTIIADAHAIPPPQARATTLPSGPIWLAEGSSAFGDLFGVTTHNGCAYLFRREARTVRLIKPWPIGRHGWAIEPAAREPGPPRGCNS